MLLLVTMRVLRQVCIRAPEGSLGRHVSNQLSKSPEPEKNARPKTADRGEARRPRQSAGLRLQVESQGKAQP